MLGVIGIFAPDDDDNGDNGNGGSDTTPPTVASTDPYDGELYVGSWYPTFTITFSEPMYQSSNIHSSLFFFPNDDTSEEYYSGDSSYWVNDKTVEIYTTAILDYSTEYLASLTYPYNYSVKDVNGNYAECVLGDIICTWTFTTEVL